MFFTPVNGRFWVQAYTHTFVIKALKKQPLHRTTAWLLRWSTPVVGIILLWLAGALAAHMLNLDGSIPLLSQGNPVLTLFVFAVLSLVTIALVIAYGVWASTEERRSTVRDKARRNMLTDVFPGHSFAMRALLLDKYTPNDLRIDDDTLRSYFNAREESNPNGLPTYIADLEILKYRYAVDIYRDAENILSAKDVSIDHLPDIRREAEMTLKVEKDRLQKSRKQIEHRIEEIDHILRTVR